MSNLKHLITLACILASSTFLFAQSLSISPSSGNYTPNGTQTFTFSLDNITEANCQGLWSISAESSSNYGDFTAQNLNSTIDLSGNLQTGSVDLVFTTPESGDLIISNITADPPGGCSYGQLSTGQITLTPETIPSGGECMDTPFSEDFELVAEGTGFPAALPSASVQIGNGTAFRQSATFAGMNSHFQVVTENVSGGGNNNKIEARNVSNQVYWESEDISISPCCYKTISVDIFGNGGQTADYVNVYYKINDGLEQFIDQGLGSFGTKTVSISSCDLPTISTTSILNIVIRIQNNNPNERHGFDNVQVTTGTQVEAPQILNVSCTPGATETTLTVDAVSECNNLEFSDDGGSNWQANNEFTAGFGETPTISVRDATFPTCGIASTAVTIDINGNCDFVLPITLLDFYGRAEADAIALYWTTSTELNNDYMVIERSLNGIDFEEIGLIEGHGTTTEAQQYTFTDNHPVSGTNYYRLRQVDIDGTEEYHPVISVLFDKPLEFGVKVSPNPARDILQVDWSLPSHEDGILRIYDTQGQLMSQRVIAAGSGRYNLPINDLPAGLYVLQMEQGGQAEALRFVKK